MKVYNKTSGSSIKTSRYILPGMGKKGKEFWAGPTWTSWHSIAATYEPTSRKAAKAYTYSLTELLPCKECRNELLNTLREYNIDEYLGSHEDFFRFTYICHDRANKAHNQTGKSKQLKYSPPYEVVRNHYFSALRD